MPDTPRLAQDIRYEFDGFQPVAMTGGSIRHSRITNNVQSTLRARLKGSGCEPLGPDAGVATISDAVRYPDALVSCTKTPDTAYVILEYAGIGLTVLERAVGEQDWRATALTADDTLHMPEIGIEISICRTLQPRRRPESDHATGDPNRHRIHAEKGAMPRFRVAPDGASRLSRPINDQNHKLESAPPTRSLA